MWTFLQFFSGEYDLKIEDVQLEDNAEFSCQVTGYGDSPALVASAKLTVLGKIQNFYWFVNQLLL